MINRIVVILSLLLIMVSGLIACNAGAGKAMLDDTEWVLESYGEPGNLKAVIADTRITVEFIGAEKMVRGSAGCNSYFGTYKLKGNRVSIPGPIAVTEMFCIGPAGVMEQEQEYLDVLQSAENCDITGDELRINCGSQVLIFKSI